jgi:protein-S-isoprenylcysteine O-methyltransferase Ste14
MDLFLIIYACWLLSEILLNRFVRSGKTDKKAADKNTELYLWLIIISAVTIGTYVGMRWSFPFSSSNQFGYSGLIVIVAGMLIRFLAIKQLGKFFTVDVTIRADHQLMQRGFYKYVRHPSYSGSLLSFIGFGLSLNNWVGALIVFLPILMVFIHRMSVEENVLSEQFGKQYQDYMAGTKRIVPFLY